MKQAIAISPPKKVAGAPVEAPKPRRRRERPRNTTTRNNTDDGDKGGRVRVRICTESGQLATANCPSTETQEFLRGEQPLSRCSIHGGSRGGGDKEKEPDATPPPDTGDKADGTGKQ